MAIPEVTLTVLDAKFAAVLPHLDERQRRLYLASEAEALGHGGIAVVARLAEVSESTIARGRDELAAGAEVLAIGPPSGRTSSTSTETLSATPQAPAPPPGPTTAGRRSAS